MIINLEEADVIGVLFEASTAHHKTVFSDNTMVVRADAAFLKKN